VGPEEEDVDTPLRGGIREGGEARGSRPRGDILGGKGKLGSNFRKEINNCLGE